MNDEADYFRMRVEGRTYISKIFTYGAQDTVGKRNVTMVLDGTEDLRLAEIDGALCLRLTGQKRRTQVTATVTHDDNQIARLTFQKFQSRVDGSYQSSAQDTFTFRDGEFASLLGFLNQIKFIDLSNEQGFKIDDLSQGSGRKAIIDSSDVQIVESIRGLDKDQRVAVLKSLSGSLSLQEINLLLGRKQALEEFERQIEAMDWAERDWQEFFEKQSWIFGYGLDYRIMRQFDRESTTAAGGSDNRNRPVVDFLTTFTDYTALVELKLPSTPIFANRAGRAGTRQFSSQFMGAVSQILEQKAEWLAFAASGEHYNRDGRKLEARTRNAKAILVVGRNSDLVAEGDDRETNVLRDTFELFRRETRTIDIVTYDELLERARFIARD
jgi:hypothetical protein